MTHTTVAPVHGVSRPRAYERVLHVALALAIVAACVIVVQKSFNFVGRAPALNVDDSIPNVAVTVAEHGRYGFLASPTQGRFEVDRTRAFFNYGPLYFYVAAALTWVMNPSLELYRMLHPLGLVAVVLLSMGVFRAWSLAGSAVIALCLFELYLDAHWPLARPDIMVSVCAALIFAFSARAVQRSESWNWLPVGFFAGNALTTHQIAAAVVPAAGIIWLWSLPVLRQDDPEQFRGRAARGFAFLVAGGVAAAMVYLVAIRFRLGDLFSLGTAGLSAYARPFGETFSSHFNYAWSSMDSATLRVVIVAFAAAGALSVASTFIGGTIRRMATAYVMPAFVVATLYQLSLGFYGNNHTGYVILSQVATLWAVAGLVAVAITWMRAHLASFGPPTAALFTLVAVGLTARADAVWLRTTSLWQARGAANVEIEDYIRQSVDPLPERAATWGSLYFGLDAGVRTDLVQFVQMMEIAGRDFSEESRPMIAPDYLLLSSYETDLDFTRYLAGHSTILNQFLHLFRRVRYDTTRLIYAPPYGMVRTYRRLAPDERELFVADEVEVNDGITRQWSSDVGGELPVAFDLRAPVTASVEFYGLKAERRSVSTVSAELDAGFYLLDIVLDRDDVRRTGYVLASTGPFFYWRGGWTQFAIPVAPYLSRDTHVELVVDHPGGALFVSRFENDADVAIGEPDLVYSLLPPANRPVAWRDAVPTPGRNGMRVASVRPIQVLGDHTGRTTARRLPPWTQWTPPNPPAASVAAGPNGRVRLTGTPANGAYLLTSPRLRVSRGQHIAVTIPAQVSAGAVEIGLLGSDNNWIVPPVQLPNRIALLAADDIEVAVVLTSSSFGAASPLDVTLGNGLLTTPVPRELYVDRLMKCRAFGAQARPAECGQ